MLEILSAIVYECFNFRRLLLFCTSLQFIIHACPGLTWPMASAIKPWKGNCEGGGFFTLIATLFLQLSSEEGCSLNVSFPTLMFQELCPSVTILFHSLWEFNFPWYAKENDNWILRTSSPVSSKEGWAIQVFPTLIFYFDHLINSFLLLSVSHKILFSLTQAPKWRDINIYHSSWRGTEDEAELDYCIGIISGQWNTLCPYETHQCLSVCSNTTPAVISVK